MTAHKTKANELVIFDTAEKNLWHVLFTVIDKRCMIFMNVAPVAVHRLNISAMRREKGESLNNFGGWKGRGL